MGLCDLTDCDPGEDCLGKHGNTDCCCFSLSNPHLYELLINAYGTFEHPVDVYTEDWSHQQPIVRTIFGGSMIGPARHEATRMSQTDRRIRKQSADVRVSKSVEWMLQAILSGTRQLPNPSGFVNGLMEALLQQRDDGTWHLDIDEMTRFVMYPVFDDTRKPSFLRKEVQKQRLFSTEEPQRPLTDPQVWKDMYRLSLVNYFAHNSVDTSAVEQERVRYREAPEVHRKEGFAELPHLYDLLVLVFAPLVDLYFVARLLKEPCLASDTLQRRPECVPVWPKLTTVFLGVNHIRNLHALLTDEQSPVRFYRNETRLDNLAMNEPIESFRCVNLQEYDISVNMDSIMRRWDTQFAQPSSSSSSSSSSSLSFGRRKQKKGGRKVKKGGR